MKKELLDHIPHVRSFTGYHPGLGTAVSIATEAMNVFLDKLADDNYLIEIVHLSSQLTTDGNCICYVLSMVYHDKDVEDKGEE